jgi:hypothetical protein
MATGKFNYVWNYLSSTIDDFKAIILGYRTYKAFLMQTGSNAPVATVVDNNLGINVSYEYDGTGYYFAFLSRDLFINTTETLSGRKVEVTITPSSSIGLGGTVIMSAYPVFFNVIAIESNVDNVDTDGLLGNYFSSVLEIKVYNK